MYRGKYSNLIKEVKQKTQKNLNNNFWKWFGNSKMKKRNGEPIIFYHSTYNNFDTFEPTIIKKNKLVVDYEKGRQQYYFTPYKKWADNFGKEHYNKKHKIMAVYLKIENPLVITHTTDWDIDKWEHYFQSKGINITKDILLKTAHPIYNKFDEKNEKWHFNYFSGVFWQTLFRDTHLFKDAFNKAGYDGVIFRDTDRNTVHNLAVVVFNSNQIKSIDNNGEWNSNSNNIYETYDYIDDTEVLLNPTKKEFNDFVNKNKWYRILLSKTGFAIWSADTPLLHMYVEDEYDVKNATHLFAYNGNIYFQDYNLIPEDFDNDMKEWYIDLAKQLDNNKILRTYFPKMNMEQSTINMFNGQKVIMEARHGKKLNLPNNSENQVINKVVNAIRTRGWDSGDIINEFILRSELIYSPYYDDLVREMMKNNIKVMDEDEELYNQAIKYILDNMDNPNSYAYKITDDIYKSSAEYVLGNLEKELKDNNIYREIHTRLSISELLKHLQKHGTGNCWAKQYENAESYNGDYSGNSYIFVGQATDKNISWYDSILLRIVNEEEDEIRLKNNAPVKITKIINKDNKKRYNINQFFSTGDKYSYAVSFRESKQNINENKLAEVQEDIKYILSSDAILFSCDPTTYDFMLKCLKQGQKPEYFYFNFYKNRPIFMNLCRSLLYRFTGNKIKGSDELIKKKISSYDGYSISKEAVKVILNGYYGKIKVGI